ncbi:MAG: peptidase [Chitinophagaceae bacterium]|nr:peptidase [Chitinophagaceae bacterium]
MEIKQAKTSTGKAVSKNGFKKITNRWSRWLHTYLSMISFLVVLFFSVTGITLNHASWFDGAQTEKKIAGTIPVAWVNVSDTSRIKKLEIVEQLRKDYGIKGYMSDFLIQDNQCSISFKGPGYSADAFINRQDGHLELLELRMGLFAVLNDLHKGRDSGKEWAWVIDLSAVLLVLVSITGLLMLFFLKNKRLNGILLAILGGIICYLVYYIWIP